jgi:hypothetical protein
MVIMYAITMTAEWEHAKTPQIFHSSGVNANMDGGDQMQMKSHSHIFPALYPTAQ